MLQELFHTNRDGLKYYPVDRFGFLNKLLKTHSGHKNKIKISYLTLLVDSPPGTRLLTAFYTVYHGSLHRQCEDIKPYLCVSFLQISDINIALSGLVMKLI